MEPFYQSTWFFILLILVLLGLIGALLVLRNKRPED
jgi:LPXTG-motif cell wall-anchored protein